MTLNKLDRKQYAVFHDLYLPRPDGKGTAQIDHVVVSPFGIFVIETKNMAGWIFGDERSRQWTQSIYGNQTLEALLSQTDKRRAKREHVANLSGIS